jgi:4-alpha-glucanotransferase
MLFFIYNFETSRKYIQNEKVSVSNMNMHTIQKLNRGAGILMPISALPSPYGIGTLGRESYEFIDFLYRAGYQYWQVLPVGPTSFGDSPYQSFSAFAGNPYFIDFNYLVEEKLISEKEINTYEWQEFQDFVDYSKIYEGRFQVLKSAFLRSNHKESKEYREFCEDSEFWLDDYSLYMAVKGHFNNKEWLSWDEDIRFRKSEAIKVYSTLLWEEIDFWKFCQFKFSEQWHKVKDYANKKGISIIGDIPLYVALDSADVWVHGDLFQLDERKKPIHVAGVPPDLFSEDGQRWGNPLYRWDEMEKQDFLWWSKRMQSSANLYDVIRIDHFIGIVNYYSIPAEYPTARIGSWCPGPGGKLMEVVKRSTPHAKIIAEDLGEITPEVKNLIQELGYPGMKVLEFGLDGNVDNDFLPHNFTTTNIVSYTGTHDNETLVGSLNSKTEEEMEFILSYFNVTNPEDLPDVIIRTLYSSIAEVVILQMQDLLKLDNSARINVPSTVGNNWKWRLTKKQYGSIEEEKLKQMAYLYGRAPKKEMDSDDANILKEV